MSNASQLNTVSGNGTQSSTGSPQSATTTSNLGTNSTAVQNNPATTSLLTAQNGGIPLHSAPIVAYDLNSAIPGTVDVSKAPVSHSGPNGLLLGFAALFIIVAVVLFWTTAKSSKTTTE
jgi:hypothetical protein